MKLKNQTALDLITWGRSFVDPDPAGDAPAGGATPPNPPAGGGDGGPTQQDIANLQEALRKEREMRKAREDELKRVASENPALLEQIKREAEAERARAELAEAQAQSRLREQQLQHERDMAEVKAKSDALIQAAKRDALRVRAEREFLASKGLAEAGGDGRTPFDYVWTLHGDLIDEDEMGPYIKGEGGTPRIDKETGKRITLAQFYGDLRKDPVHGMHFQPMYGSGGGSRAGVAGRVGHAQDLSGMASTDLISQGLRAQRETVRR